MRAFQEIIKPKLIIEPDYKTGRSKNGASHEFKCKICDNLLSPDFKRQINNSWTGSTENANEEDQKELFEFYNIGLTNKSIDGGHPVFDKIECSKYGTIYNTYCGVTEFSN